MRRLILTPAARDDLAAIEAYIGRQSRNLVTAENFVNKLLDYCQTLADLPGVFGRARPELRPGLRSVAFGRYVIFLRYPDDPAGTLEIVNVLHGARDIDAFFEGEPDGEP